ncbi:choice-of-anchor tandem repeat GloVer-containing protein [Gloeobacter kilaueensis]|uniref:choice-of-anchor tandem repeat GloVer-containing protein n=1 Tax=Gloeobacter kilaueensis TaxID=1416614 RepID=UPI0016515D11|nr:choice-of-anchor tandem repeat GloVer-containing protein [Gloeobacter kilaueensis]
MVGDDGNYYGTTTSGGAYNLGTVYRLTPEGKLTTLHSFSGSKDGFNPKGRLLKASDGNFYGTTMSGGIAGQGTLFRITPQGQLKILYTFTSQSDGGLPNGGLIQARDGYIYGTTSFGGANFGGTIFRLLPGESLTTIYAFGFNDGTNPASGLTETRDGKLYGTTASSGPSGGGSVFRLDGPGSLVPLYFFNSFSSGGGSSPQAALIEGSDGNLYGTTFSGGVAGFTGTAFRITPDGNLTMLHSFSGFEGSSPQAELFEADDGNFYGTTSGGGLLNGGTIFQLKPTGELTTLNSFDYFNNPQSGSSPAGGLIGSAQQLMGTTQSGGTYSRGTIFRFNVPTLSPCSPGALNVGQTQGNLRPTDCRSPIEGPQYFADRYTFTGTAGQQLNAVLSSSSNIDRLYLIDPNGQIVQGGANQIPSFGGSYFLLPISGTYTFEVSTSQANVRGSYLLTLTTAAGCTVTPLTIPQTVNGSLSTIDCQSSLISGSYEDRYTFEGTAGQQIEIDLSSTAFDSYLGLLSPSGSLIVTDDDGGGNLNSRIVYTLTESGTYTIEATALSFGATGPYTLSITQP